jgi:anaerobic selenocysteine-containing dehydrogenase
MTHSKTDGVEIRPKLVIETGSHLRLIEVFEGANCAAAAQSDNEVIKLSNSREKNLQLRGIACVYCASGCSITDTRRCGRGRGFLRGPSS